MSTWFRPSQVSRAAFVMVAFCFLALPAAVIAAELENTLSMDSSNPAKNLARLNCGATIDRIGSDGRVLTVSTAAEKEAAPTTLLLDDDTLSYPLAEGDTTFVVSFPRVSVLDRFTFVNENAAAQGDVSIAVSNYRLPAHSRRWNEVSAGTAFSGNRLIDLSLLGIEARYVKLTFHAAKAGRIAALGLYGGQSLQKFAARQRGVTRITNTAAARRLEDMLNFNFANVYARAQIVFVSSGAEALAKRMIDDDVITAFEFAPGDRQPTVVVRLADREKLHRVSAVYKMQRGRLDVFLLQELGDNPGDLRNQKPVASVTDETGGGKAAVDFDPNGAQYVALRWTPADATVAHGFEVAEVSAFGEMSLSMLSTIETPDIYADISIGMVSPLYVPSPPVLLSVSP